MTIRYMHFEDGNVYLGDDKTLVATYKLTPKTADKHAICTCEHIEGNDMTELEKEKLQECIKDMQDYAND